MLPSALQALDVGIPRGGVMVRSVVRFLWALCALPLLGSSPAFAQNAISGAVRDTSGAVMPGVSVEVASLVLIEKVVRHPRLAAQLKF
jgi:hypothetical protein